MSSATLSVNFVINSSSTVSGTATTGTLGAYNARPWHSFDTGTLPNANCPASGSDFICTVTLKLPPGSDDVTITACSITGGCTLTSNPTKVLSQQRQTLTVVVATANSFNVVLDANVNIMIVNGSGSCQNGPVGTAFGSVGTSPVTFTLSNTDTAGKTIVTPGLPKIEIQDNTATYQAASGTINGTGGTIGFTINQAAQTFTLTPSNSTTTNASINVKEVPPNSNGGSDDLTFAPTKTFTFSTGTAPPSHQFLAAVEQTGVGSGKVDFFNVTVDGGNQPAGFTAFSPASLAVTVSTNDATQNDVDNPASLLWDSTGDLLIGNGGSSGNGNLACVPVGAIATGANSSTTVTTNIHDPVGLAYESRNGTVAVGNNANSGTPPLAQYVLTGNYAASTTAGATTLHNGLGSIGQSVVNMPSLAAGTFAATLTDGCEVDPAHKSCGAATGVSQVVLFNNTGITTTMTDTSTFHIDEPRGITWDGTNSQLIVANFGAWHPSVAFFTTAGAFVKTDGHDYFGASQNPFMVAANGTGLFAVAYTTAIAGDEVQIFTNAAGGTAPVPLFNPIPYDAQTNNTCSSAYVYGSSAIVTSLVWLSNTRLLVGLQTSTGSANGYYIYDTASTTTPAQWDFGNGASCQSVGAIPAQKAFQIITNKPLAAAYKP
ncbi:MAG: hypothetical protein M3N49_00625 [Candidatus Eremiobacteraeota bacterium]|nr:hypothetical protein [Candidatus Eremiobacteraeota bacterium]